jgi:DNA polymerase elongation subunit (family B)
MGLAYSSGAPLDYDHYLERQLRPIAQSIAQALGASADDWLGDAGQLGLFSSSRCVWR